MKKILFFCCIISVFALGGLTANAENFSTAQAGANAQLNQGDFSQTFEASEGLRDFPNAPGLVLPGFGTMIADPTKTHEFQPMAELESIMQEWTTEKIASFMQSGDKYNVDTDLRIVNKLEPSTMVKIAMKKPTKYVYVGQITAHCTKKDITSGAAFAVSAKDAMKAGGNVLLLATEGAKRTLDVSSYGLALGYVHMDVSSQGSAGSGAAGIGYARGSTSYSHQPFVRFLILKVDDRTYRHVK